MFTMIVRIPVQPGRTGDVLELMNTIMPVVRAETGCQTFTVYTADEPDVVWLHEVYTTREFHDHEHEAQQEVKDLLARLPGLCSGPWTVHTLDVALQR